jgi:glycosyltransferase involved in cell wall biosynthesis
MPFDHTAADDRIRVLRVITRLNIGGPSIQAIELSSRLADRGHQTLLAHGALGEGEGDMRYLLDGRRMAVDSIVEIPHLQRRIAPIDDVRAVVEVFQLLRQFRPAIVHTHMAKAGAVGRLATLIYNRTVARERRARLVHTYHGHVLEGYFSSGITSLFLAIERLLARATDRIVAISPRIREELLDELRIGRRDQYRVVPLGFDLRELTSIDATVRQTARDTLHIPRDAPVVTTVGRLTPIKQHGLFLETAALIAASEPRTVFLIVGDGELRRALEEQARALGIADRTRFLGWRRDLAVIYGATDVFLLTSRNEGTPVALIESLAAGVPGVSTDVGGVRDVIDSDEVGLVAPPGDARSLAEQTLSLLADPTRRCAMGERGRQSVVSRYRIDRLVDDIEALYREVLY